MRTGVPQLSSPYHEARLLLDSFRNGDLDADGFVEALDEYDQRLQILYQGLAPEADDEQTTDEELRDSLEGIQLFSDASEQLRSYAEDGDEETAQQALELARAAHERFSELVETRGEVIGLLEQLYDDASGPASEELWSLSV